MRVPRKFHLAIFSLILLGFAAPGMAAPKGRGPAPVTVSKVRQDTVQAKVTLTGNAEAHRLITVASSLEELVVKGAVEEGQRVKKGQVLVRLDSSRLRLRLAVAKAALREARTQLAQLERDLARNRSLFRKGSTTQKALEDAQTAFVRQQAVVVRASREVDLLAHDLALCAIRSPRSGVVVNRMAYSGEWVKKGGPILRLAVLDPLKVVVKTPEKYLPNIKPGQAVTLTADALPGRTFQGAIKAVIPEGDPTTRAFPVQVRVDNPQGALMPGMLIRVTMPLGKPRLALLIPKDALVSDSQGHHVYKVAGGKAVQVKVKLESLHDGQASVTGNLKPGDLVVVRGNERLFPGQDVEPRIQAPAKAKP